MKASRLGGAALACGAILASGTVHAQLPLPLSPGPYPAPSSYYLAPYGRPASPLQSVPTSSNGPVNYSPASRPGGQGGATSLIGDPPISVLANPAQPAPATTANGPSNSSVETTSPGNTYPQAGNPNQAIGAAGQYPAANQNYATNQYPDSIQYSTTSQNPSSSPYPVTGQATAPGQSTIEASRPIGMGYNGGAAFGGGPGHGLGIGAGSMGAGWQPNIGAGRAAVGAPGATCAPGDACYAPHAPRWYAGVYGLLLNRDLQNHFTFSFDTANEAVQYTDAKDVSIDWGGGFAVSVGRYFNCGCNALELVYWGWFPEDSAIYTFEGQMTGALNGIFNWNSLDYDGSTADTWVDDARVHALFRETEVHNVEANLLRLGNGCGSVSCCYTPWQYSLVAGLRYFRFEDHLIFGSDTTDAVFNGQDSEIFYDIETVNKLYGFQLGGVGTYCVSPRLAFNAGTKFGIFGNHISHRSSIGGVAGLAIINNGPNGGQEWLVQNNKDDLSFLGEMFLGGSYCIGQRWTISGGYRAVAVTGLAMPTDQIYPDLRGINDVRSIESNSSLILHGAYFGAQYYF